MTSTERDSYEAALADGVEMVTRLERKLRLAAWMLDRFLDKYPDRWSAFLTSAQDTLRIED